MQVQHRSRRQEASTGPFAGRCYRLRPLPDYSDPDLGPLVARRYIELAGVAVQLIGAAAADPPRAVPIAEAEGITLHVFDVFDDVFSDLRLILGLLLVGKDHSPKCLRGAMGRGLKAAGCWDDQQIAANLLTGGSMAWSKQGLDALFDMYPRGVAAVRYNARRTLALRDRIARAQSLYAEAVLAVRDEPGLSPGTAAAARRTILFTRGLSSGRARREVAHVGC